jgi:hypothetical protein
MSVALPPLYRVGIVAGMKSAAFERRGGRHGRPLRLPRGHGPRTSHELNGRGFDVG